MWRHRVSSSRTGPSGSGKSSLAFNTLYARYIADDPRHPGGRQLLFYAGDDTVAKATFHDVADSMGFAPVDAGSLREGGRLMQIGGPLSALHALKQD